MKCEFCREEMDAEAVVCPHCRRETSAAKSAKRRGFVYWALIGCGALVIVVMVLGAIGSNVEERPLSERIKLACAEEYPGDEAAQATCQVNLAVEAVAKSEAEKVDRAASSAGVR